MSDAPRTRPRWKQAAFTVAAIGIVVFALEGVCRLVTAFGVGPLAGAAGPPLPGASMERSRYFTWHPIEFDPALGFLEFEFLTWIGPGEVHRFRDARPDDRDIRAALIRWLGSLQTAMSKAPNPRLLITLGGSTTASGTYGNWPEHIPDAATQRGVQQSVFVLNGGHNGFTTFQEKIFLTSWLLPLLRSAGLTPDAVVALDGVNDVNLSVLGYAFYERFRMPLWYSHYPAYHQQVASHIDRLQRGPLFTINTSHWMVRSLGRAALFVIPYSARMALELFARLSGAAAAAPPLQEMPGSEERWLVVNDDVRREILDAFQTNLIDLAGTCAARGIPFRAFLQPVFLPRYAPGPPAEDALFPDINSSPRYFPGQELGGDFSFDWSTIYPAIEKMYADLGGRFAGEFVSLTQVFRTHQESPNYVDDSMHYSDAGSGIIASSILDVLISDGILQGAAARTEANAIVPVPDGRDRHRQ